MPQCFETGNANHGGDYTYQAVVADDFRHVSAHHSIDPLHIALITFFVLAFGALLAPSTAMPHGMSSKNAYVECQEMQRTQHAV